MNIKHFGTFFVFILTVQGSLFLSIPSKDGFAIMATSILAGISFSMAILAAVYFIIPSIVEDMIKNRDWTVNWEDKK